MAISFETRADAENAGYVSANAKGKTIKERYRGCCISSRDISAQGSVGYSFALAVTIPKDIAGRPAFVPVTFGQAVGVRLNKARNRDGRRGVTTLMFPPDVYRSGIDAAKQHIDQWISMSPGAAERAKQREDQIAAREATRHARLAARRSPCRGSLRTGAFREL